MLLYIYIFVTLLCCIKKVIVSKIIGLTMFNYNFGDFLQRKQENLKLQKYGFAKIQVIKQKLFINLII